MWGVKVRKRPQITVRSRLPEVEAAGVSLCGPCERPALFLRPLLHRPFRKFGDGSPTSPELSSLKRIFFTTFVSKIDQSEEMIM